MSPDNGEVQSFSQVPFCQIGDIETIWPLVIGSQGKFGNLWHQCSNWGTTRLEIKDTPNLLNVLLLVFLLETPKQALRRVSNSQNRELDVVYERNPDETSAAAAASEPSDSVVMGSKRLEMAYMDWDWAYCIHTVPESHSLYAAREEEILMFNLKNKEVTKVRVNEL